ncbi:MAG TPA: hypothetical protein VFM55_12505 [Micromonosporaceae bacterium]|nr:hypothetical protein [Micromonosporaceae bacterium]
MTVAQPTIDRQAFWSLSVGVPVLVSVLRLWVEAGGDLHITLLLVSNVGPVNLFTALVVTVTWLVSGTLVGVYTLGALTREAASTGGGTPWYLLASRQSRATPGWLKVIVFGFAALTWPVLLLPLLLFAAFVASYPDEPEGPPPDITAAPQDPPMPARRDGQHRLLWWAVPIYLVIFAPAAVLGIERGHFLPAVLVFLPPVLLALGAHKPIPASVVPLFSGTAHVVAGVLLVAAVSPALSTPVLPLSVIAVGAEGEEPLRYVVGNVVEVDDTGTAVLLERGGIEFIPTGQIQRRTLCPEADQAPRYRLWVHGIHIEDSLLQGIGRAHRPAVPLHPTCRRS